MGDHHQILTVDAVLVMMFQTIVLPFMVVVWAVIGTTNLYSRKLLSNTEKSLKWGIKRVWFVQFLSEKSASTALEELSGQLLDGRNIRVFYASKDG
ncbi:hypothetical protein C5167_003786 [Papaver somniferum]|uniref:RRM domain-containing protein n=1 Tax=Papaver somniferum TaxID=3469 RepID=A0A4Y7L5B3_PAPSO|nr:hypothetical protein C5167_003786 [Papaver somniferum]